jgi:hypothetical protein
MRSGEPGHGAAAAGQAGATFQPGYGGAAEEQAAPAKSRRQRNARRVARKLASMRVV